MSMRQIGSVGPNNTCPRDESEVQGGWVVSRKEVEANATVSDARYSCFSLQFYVIASIRVQAISR